MVRNYVFLGESLHEPKLKSFFPWFQPTQGDLDYECVGVIPSNIFVGIFTCGKSAPFPVCASSEWTGMVTGGMGLCFRNLNQMKTLRLMVFVLFFQLIDPSFSGARHFYSGECPSRRDDL